MAKRALVLGGGGVTGVAWELGLIAGLVAEGIDLPAADMIIGTSAGSVVGAQIASAQDPERLYQRQLEPPVGEIPARLGWTLLARWAWIYLTTPDPARMRRRIGKLALAARTVPEAERRAVLEGRLTEHDWPARPLKLTTIDAATGEFVVFDAAGDASLLDAVSASCAVPGVWPPVTIGRRRYIDGGMRSSANADLADGCQRVVIIAPLARGTSRSPGPNQQAETLRAGGAKVTVISPDQAALAAIGRNVLDPARRAPAARAGRAQAALAAEQVREVWLASHETADSRPAES
jgi:NTE family protein